MVKLEVYRGHEIWAYPYGGFHAYKDDKLVASRSTLTGIKQAIRKRTEGEKHECHQM